MTPKDRELAQTEKGAYRAIEQRAYSVVNAHHHFHGRPSRFQFEYRPGVLVVRGSVPTFYLKQILQHLLVDVEDVGQIDNQVQVISAQGFSNARQAAPEDGRGTTSSAREEPEGKASDAAMKPTDF